jgi:hypothetical protein
MEDIQAMHTQNCELTFTSSTEKGRVRLSVYPTDQTILLQVLNERSNTTEQCVLEGGESWTVKISGRTKIRVTPAAKRSPKLVAINLERPTR